MTTEEPLATGHAALAVGRWSEARTAFEEALATKRPHIARYKPAEPGEMLPATE